MNANGEILWWIFILGLSVLFIFVPQWLSRRKRAQRMASLQPGDRVVTIGGFVGTLVSLDPERERACLRLAEGVEVEVLSAAISRTIVDEPSGYEPDAMAGR